MKIYTYSFLLRGFSPFCQPMNGLVSHDDNIGRWGTVTYSRPLSDGEIEEYELIKA
jgi:hypothetical protein